MFQLSLLCLKRHIFFQTYAHSLIQLNSNKRRALLSEVSGQPTYLESLGSARLSSLRDPMGKLSEGRHVK